MSLMTQSLLLEAQSLRLDGELDASVDLLRTVLSQCNSDLRSGGHPGQNTPDRTDDNQTQAALKDGDTNIADRNDATKMGTTYQLRRLAAYQLALLLLQRSGRRTYFNARENKNLLEQEHGTNDKDEFEADELLWKMGYRLRLSKLAFGYPTCDCKHWYLQRESNDELQTKLGKESEEGRKVSEASSMATPKLESQSKLPLVVIDSAMPSSLFDALQHAFRPDSRYWAEFYCKIGGKGDDDDDNKINQFASHNIKLPPFETSNCSDSTPPMSPLMRSLHNSNSLLEQAAIIVRHHLQQHFPRLRDATSVEIWCHRRPPDGHHQLHYDMDEIRLWERRKKSQKIGDNYDMTTSENGVGGKRQKTCPGEQMHDGVNDKQKSCQLKVEIDGISCPIVSCVMTINIPNHSEMCNMCGKFGEGAPTIVSSQSIMKNNTLPPKHSDEQVRGASVSEDGGDSTGWLCYPRINRLLAFEGSLLHGVVPGIPGLRSSNPHDDNDSSSSDYSSSDGGFSAHNSDGLKRSNNQRVTLMMGFWGNEVCLANNEVSIGPNVPFPRLTQRVVSDKDKDWVDEFRAYSFNEVGICQATNSNSASPDKELDRAIRVNPLWAPIKNNERESVFGSYSCGGINRSSQFHGRFFLNSLSSVEIDKEVLLL